ncbi:beta-ketoacyl synthase N-terminal-like domain-containing protein [Streptomyces sp. NPDC002138]|uniref:type I polyketide synthase n=1 Tax=Streptomyces sp. NPDC002138 TaxID=3154410 RepID=UPI00332B4A47
MAEPRRGPRPTDAAIVGMGAVFPGSADLSAYRRNLVAGTDAIREVPPERWDPEVYYDPSGAEGPPVGDRFYCRRGGFVDGLAAFDPTRFGIMPATVEGAEPDQLLALHATAEAIADAGGEDRLPADRSRIGVVLGRGGFMGVATARLDQRVRTAHQVAQTLRELAPELGERRIAEVRAAFQEALGPERPDASIGLVPSFTAARTANRLDFRGPAYTLDAACASSLLAVDQAVGLLASGRCDVVVAGAAHHCHIATLWSVFTQLRALSPSERIRPFDRRADGTLLSEGTGVVLLKRLADAERDGDRIYAVIRGTGVAGDGRAASLMSPLVAGQVRALERAWREAGLDPRAADALGLLEAHGTGTPVGDAAELDTLAQVFGPPVAGQRAVGLGSVKSMLGHTMQASGMAGLIKAALAVHDGVLPPTLHLEEPHGALARTRMRPVTVAEPWERGAAPRRAGVNAFGFGGINAHVVLEEAPGAGAARPAAPVRRFLPLGTGPERPGPERSGPERSGPVRSAVPAGGPGARDGVLLLAAPTAGRLAGLLAAAARSGTGGDDVGGGAGGGDEGGPCRLAVLGPTPQRLALAAKVLARGRAWRGRGDVWFTPEPLLAGGSGGADRGRVAFLFPGLEPEFTPVLDDVADLFALERPRLGRGDELIGRALDAIATGRFFARVLPELGIEADVLAGHSLGEWAAMVAAGMYPRRAVDTFLGSLRPGSLTVPDLVYAALGCGARRAGAALHGLDRVVVSHDNCPHQSVICGDPAQVADVLERLSREGVLGQELPFRSGFHTPMWEPYLGQVRAAFDRLPLRPPALPVWSATTASPFPEAPDEVRELVVRHLLEPVDFRSLTLRLYEEAGVRAFVAMGPGSLPGFVEDTLRDRPHLAVATSTPRLTGTAALRRTAAALWTEGLTPRWTRLTNPVPTGMTGTVTGAGVTGAADTRAVTGAAATRAPSAGVVTGGAVTGATDPRTVTGTAPRAVREAAPEPATAPVGASLPATAPTGASRTPNATPHAAPASAPPAGTAPVGAVPAAVPPTGASRTPGVSPSAVPPHTRPTPGAPAGASPTPTAPTGAPPAVVPPHTPPTPPGRMAGRRAAVPLDLGSPLVRLGAGARGLLGPVTGGAGAGGHPGGPDAQTGVPRPAPPLLSALDAVLDEARDAARSVTEAWTRPGPLAVPARDSRPLTLSLAALPYVRDHCVYEQPADWPEDSDRFPVVPMTTMLELAADAALRAAPAGSVVLGYEDVRAMRWLAVEPAVRIEVGVRSDGPGRVRVALGDCATLTVLLGPRYDGPPAARPGGPGPRPLTGERPAPVSAEALYRDRWMFHGPGFAGVHEVQGVGSDGIRGVLRALPAPGALLDAAGQLFGHWMQLSLPVDRLVFPATIERIRFHGPAPAPGALVQAVARVREVRDLTVLGDVELRRTPPGGGAGGALWARIEGWTYRRFAADERVWPMKFTPEVCGIGEPQPGGWCAARRRWTDPASQELVMRRYLGAAERAVYERLAPRARAPWLLGRIAAKDALRQLLWDGGAGPVFPVEVPVGNDAHGRPVPGGPLAAGLHLSLAHKDRLAVALAHPTGPVGIDVETVTADPAALLRIACGPAEARLARRLAERDGAGEAAALTALWCAKEAAAKAAGTGLGGRPREWRVTALEPAGLRVLAPDGHARLVRTTVLPAASGPPLDHVVAWTAPPTGSSLLPSHPTEFSHGI